jgi:deoxyhypusine synthase
VSWGKIDSDQLPDTVICYCDTTIALPLVTAYALARHAPRKRRRLHDRREELMRALAEAYQTRGRGATAPARR